MWLFVLGLFVAFANVPLLLAPVRQGEARMWRALGVQRQKIVIAELSARRRQG